MAHAIFEEDQGVVWGTTWHHVPSYKELERPVTIIEAMDTLNVPLRLEPLYFKENGNDKNIRGFSIVRSDNGRVLKEYVGPRFVLEDSRGLVNYISEHLLAAFPDLKIESVGTLFHGATQFVNLVVDRFHVKGDKSETLCRLMWWNPIGSGSYKVCAHGVRVVCNNTLRAADAQADAAGATRKMRHVAGGFRRMNEIMAGMTEKFLGLQRQKEILNNLASMPVTSTYVRQFSRALYPNMPQENERRNANILEKRIELQELFNGVAATDMTPEVRFSRYGLLNAVTYQIGHPQNLRTDTDLAMVQWDALTGDRGDVADRALALLHE